jgi:mRNA export factor
VLGRAMVICTADKKNHIFDLDSSLTQPIRSEDSSLKMQSRAVKIFHDQKFFAAGSIEGRCSIRCLDGNQNTAVDAEQRPLAFAFRCHRDTSNIFPINTIDTNPQPEFHAVFTTGGSDGSLVFWNREKRQRLKEVKAPAKQPVTDGKWNAAGDCMVFASCYDWSKGPEFYSKDSPATLYLRHTTPEKDLRMKPAAPGR